MHCVFPCTIAPLCSAPLIIAGVGTANPCQYHNEPMIEGCDAVMATTDRPQKAAEEKHLTLFQSPST